MNKTGRKTRTYYYFHSPVFRNQQTHTHMVGNTMLILLLLIREDH